MKQLQPQNKPRPLTTERRRTLAYLLVANAMGMDVKTLFDHLPDDAEDSYESFVVRVDIRCHYAHEPERLRFQKHLSKMLDGLGKGMSTDEQREMYDWMVEHIVFPEWDSEEFQKYWNFAAYRQRQQKAKRK